MTGVAIAGTMLLTGCSTSTGMSYSPDLDMDYNASIRTYNTQESIDYATKIAKEAKGTVVSQDVNKESASIEIEVPSENMETFLDKLDNRDEVLDIRSSGYYYDDDEDDLDDYDFEKEYDDFKKETTKTENPEKSKKSTISIYYTVPTFVASWNGFVYAITHVFEWLLNFIICLATLCVYLLPYALVVGIIVWFATRKSRLAKKQAKKAKKENESAE